MRPRVLHAASCRTPGGHDGQRRPQAGGVRGQANGAAHTPLLVAGRLVRQQRAHLPLDGQHAALVANDGADFDARSVIRVAVVAAQADMRRGGQQAPDASATVRSPSRMSRRRLTSADVSASPVAASLSVRTHRASDLTTSSRPPPSSSVPLTPMAPSRKPRSVSIGVRPRCVRVRLPLPAPARPQNDTRPLSLNCA